MGLQLGGFLQVGCIVLLKVFSGFEHLLGLNLIALEVRYYFRMPLVQLEDHPLVAVLDLAETLENVDRHVGNVRVVFQS